MARKQVMEVACERCERVETLDPDKVKPVQAPAISIEFEGTKVSFGDLCGPCYRSVKGHIENVVKKIKGLSPDRKENKDVGEQITDKLKASEDEKQKDVVAKNQPSALKPVNVNSGATKKGDTPSPPATSTPRSSDVR